MLRIVANLALVLALSSSSLLAVDIHDTRLLTDPAVSARPHRVRVRQRSLGRESRRQSGVRRLTSHPGVESRPALLAGRKVDRVHRPSTTGNTDVYVVPSEGGVPQRLTWHPGEDIVPQGFTPDGKAVLFTSPREVYTMRYRQLFTVPVGGGAVTKLPIPQRVARRRTRRTASASPTARSATRSRSGSTIAAARPRGCCIFDPTTLRRRADPAAGRTRANDTDPMWIGNTVYFRSDRDGEFNLYSLRPDVEAGRAAHAPRDFPVAQRHRRRRARSSSSRPAVCTCSIRRRGKRHAPEDRRGRGSRWRRGPRFVKGDEVRPRAPALADRRARGVRVSRRDRHRPRGEGRRPQPDRSRPARTTASPAWSPDGKSIAWFSDASRRVRALHRAAGRQGHAARRSSSTAPASTRTPEWSPDGKRIALHRQLALDLRGSTSPAARSTKISSQRGLSPGTSMLDHAWSPDSKWLAYTRDTRDVHADRSSSTRVAQKKSYPLTDGLSDASEPVFDRERQVPLLLRVDGRRPGAGLVLAVERRHARHDQRHLPGRAAEGRRRRRSRRRATRRSPAAETAKDDGDEATSEEGRREERRRRRRRAGQA